MRRILSVAMAIAITAGAEAQELGPEAFRCAALALHAPEDSSERREAQRLFELGYESFLSWFAVELRPGKESGAAGQD